jgi:predicted transcriptional regulator
MTLANFQIDVSNKLGQIFSQNSSTQNYDPEFKKFKKQNEKTKLNLKSKNLEEYNRPFSLDELRKSFLSMVLHTQLVRAIGR